MKLNLGCGTDIRAGYVNVDFRTLPGVDVVCDLLCIPWDWEDESVDEILMLDFLEHFSYRKTDEILKECYRILKPHGELTIQVPDFEECAKAVLRIPTFYCNRCGWLFRSEVVCGQCGQSYYDIAQSAIERLYGGQDYPGNWHHTAFTPELLRRRLLSLGFSDIFISLTNENGETYAQNWNFKMSARKAADGLD